VDLEHFSSSDCFYEVENNASGVNEQGNDCSVSFKSSSSESLRFMLNILLFLLVKEATYNISLKIAYKIPFDKNIESN